MFKRKKVGLALSGGGARGLAHLGVLKVLEENKIPIDFIAGTSMGAFIGAMYSAEPNIKKLEKDLSSKEWRKSFDYSILPSKGLIKGDKIEKWLEQNIKDLDFKDLRIPLFVTAFDLKSKQEIIFNKGDVAKAVRASISIPGVFVPVENNGRILVDGGVVDPIPTEILSRAGADIIIAVNVNAIKERKVITNEVAVRANNKSKIPGILSSTTVSLNNMWSELSCHDLRDKNIKSIINVFLDDISIFEFDKFDYIVSEGEKVAKKEFPRIKKLIKRNYLRSFIESLNKNTGIDKIVKPIQDIEKEA